MPLPNGTRLGSYEVLAPIGAGGMGEVYRSRDTKLGREVAIKILPEAVAQDPDKRFIVLMPSESPEPRETQSHVTVVVNFLDEVRRRVAAGNK
jgi:serine/threonine protein kinase